MTGDVRRVGLLVLLVATPAMACPEAALCLKADPAPKLAAEEPPPPPPRQQTEDMPWIWEVLRTQVYTRLPRYEDAQSFSFVLSPVVVKGQFDTVPGVGLAGDF
jgi:hypothetical protein